MPPESGARKRPVLFLPCSALFGLVRTSALTRTFLSYTSATSKVTMGNQSRIFAKRLSMFLVHLFGAYVLLLIGLRLFEYRMIFFPNYPSRLEGDWHPRTLPS